MDKIKNAPKKYKKGQKRNFLVFLGLFLFFWGDFCFIWGIYVLFEALFVFFVGIFNMTLI